MFAETVIPFFFFSILDRLDRSGGLNHVSVRESWDRVWTTRCLVAAYGDDGDGDNGGNAVSRQRRCGACRCGEGNWECVITGISISISISIDKWDGQDGWGG